jgi:hypothetical protein
VIDMIAYLLASALTLETILAGAEQFIKDAGLPLETPFKTNMVSNFKVHPEGDGFVNITNNGKKYTFTYAKGKISSFADLEVAVHRKLTRLDPQEMAEWSKERCVLDEKQATDIARKYLQRLGFKEEDFEPPQCHRYRWQPSEENSDHVLFLPVFYVNYLKKGAQENEYGFGPKVQMSISCTTSQLVYFTSLAMP